MNTTPTTSAGLRSRKILFVCHGNICRSPMAEYYFRHASQQAKAGALFDVASAAVSSEEVGNPVYPPAAAMLAQHGIDCRDKRARQVTTHDFEYYDLLIAMDQSNLRALRRMAARLGTEAERKVSLLLDHTPSSDAAHHARDVADPWYTGDFRRAWDDIVAGCQALLHTLL